MSMRRLIVGLGNPGARYERTRHNLGFMALDRYAASRNARFRRTKFGLAAELDDVWLLKPQTFMNLSGDAVGPWVKYYRMLPQDLIVVVDDLDLPLGTLRFRLSGSSGGHNGLKSIMAAIGTEAFPRLKLGISRPPDGLPVIDWVLTRFSQEDLREVDEVMDRAAAAIQCALDQGIEAAMNRYNG